MSVPTEDHGRDALVIPGYRLLDEIERRPELDVTFRAQRLGGDVPVRVTVIDRRLSADPVYRAALEHQLAVVSSLEHPALAAVLEAGDLQGAAYLAVERPPGVELSRMLDDGPLAPAHALALLEPVADLLDRLGAAGCYGLDLTAEGIVVGGGEHAVVTRLAPSGVAVAGEAGEVSSEALWHSAPELLRGHPPGPRTRVYVLATLAFEALTATSPFPITQGRFDRHSAAAILRARRLLPAPAVSAHRGEMGAEVDAVLRRALSETPSLRHSSARMLMRRLRQALADAGAVEASKTLATARPPSAESAVEASPARTAARRTSPAARASREALSASRPRASSGGHDGLERHRRAPSTRGVVRVALPAAALALLLGVVVADRPDAAPPTPVAPHTVTESTDALRISHPSTWSPSSTVRPIPGLALRDSLALEHSPDGGRAHAAQLLAGMVSDTGASLLPAKLERQWSGVLRRERVRIGNHEAYRYRDVPLDDKRANLTLYAVPTNAGTATLACLAPAFSDTLQSDCEAMVTTLELRGARSLPVGPNAGYGRTLTQVLRDVDSARRAGRFSLRFAKRHRGQGRRASDLAQVFRRGARRLAAAGPTAGTATVHSQLVSGMRGTRDAYRTLAAAATRADRGAYDAARRSVTARERALTQTLARMSDLGYRVR